MNNEKIIAAMNELLHIKSAIETIASIISTDDSDSEKIQIPIKVKVRKYKRSNSKKIIKNLKYK